MRFKIVALIACGIILALGGAFGTFHYTRALELELASARGSLRAFGDTVDIPVAAQDFAPGTLLAAESFVTVKVPQSYLPENMLRLLPEVGEGESLVSLTNLKAGHALLDTDLARSGAGSRGGLLPVGNGKIFAIAPRNLADFGGALAEGSRVDLILTRNIGGGKSESRLIADGLRVRIPPAPAPDAEPGPALAGKLLLEGEFTDALRGVVAGQDGFLSILLSDGTRSTGSDTVLIGPTDLEKLPLVVRQALDPGQAAPSLIGRITGESGARAKCPTAVVRGGTRSVSEVPC
ncbi:hypothetical protein [Pseudogemmobacter sonorensis]|uniref:hypothetical protein n=1 Tax=Pseudogemmobacter sonorensis TaxID=2989681 RepID=UPI00369FCA9E